MRKALQICNKQLKCSTAFTNRLFLMLMILVLSLAQTIDTTANSTFNATFNVTTNETIPLLKTERSCIFEEATLGNVDSKYESENFITDALLLNPKLEQKLEVLRICTGQTQQSGHKNVVTVVQAQTFTKEGAYHSYKIDQHASIVTKNVVTANQAQASTTQGTYFRSKHDEHTSIVTNQKCTEIDFTSDTLESIVMQTSEDQLLYLAIYYGQSVKQYGTPMQQDFDDITTVIQKQYNGTNLVGFQGFWPHIEPLYQNCFTRIVYTNATNSYNGSFGIIPTADLNDQQSQQLQTIIQVIKESKTPNFGSVIEQMHLEMLQLSIDLRHLDIENNQLLLQRKDITEQKLKNEYYAYLQFIAKSIGLVGAASAMFIGVPALICSCIQIKAKKQREQQMRDQIRARKVRQKEMVRIKALQKEIDRATFDPIDNQMYKIPLTELLCMVESAEPSSRDPFFIESHRDHTPVGYRDDSIATKLQSTVKNVIDEEDPEIQRKSSCVEPPNEQQPITKPKKGYILPELEDQLSPRPRIPDGEIMEESTESINPQEMVKDIPISNYQGIPMEVPKQDQPTDYETVIRDQEPADIRIPQLPNAQNFFEDSELYYQSHQGQMEIPQMTQQMIKFVIDRRMTPVKIDKNTHFRGGTTNQETPSQWFATLSAKPHLEPKKYNTKNYLKNGLVDQEWINKIKRRTLKTEQRKRQKPISQKLPGKETITNSIMSQTTKPMSANHPIALTSVYGKTTVGGGQVNSAETSQVIDSGRRFSLDKNSNSPGLRAQPAPESLTEQVARPYTTADDKLRATPDDNVNNSVARQMTTHATPRFLKTGEGNSRVKRNNFK